MLKCNQSYKLTMASINVKSNMNTKNDTYKRNQNVDNGTTTELHVVEHKADLNGPQPTLRKEINFLQSTTIMIGIVIGSGIFISPVSITRHCGSVGLSLIIWMLSGIMSIFIASCYTELAAMFPRAGGEYAFFKSILGDLPAFLMAWMYFIIINPVFYAILALTTSQYLFKIFFIGCAVPFVGVKIFSIWLLVTIVALNSVYVRYVTRVQTFFTAVKVIALLVIIAAGAKEFIYGNRQYLEHPFEGSNWNAGAIAIALYTGIFTYGGWQYVFHLMEEVQSGEKIVLKCSVVSLSTVIVLYMLTNLSYMLVLSPDEMMTSEAVAMSFAEKTLGVFAISIPLFVACSTTGAINGSILGGSRVTFAAARDELFPKVLAMIHVKYRTPWTSLWISCSIAVVYVLSGEAITLIEYEAFVGVILLTTTVICVLWMKWKYPNRHRPVNLPSIVPWSSLFILLMMLLLGLYYQPVNNGIGVLLILSGIPVYMLAVVWKVKAASLDKLSGRLSMTLQKCFMLLPPKAQTD